MVGCLFSHRRPQPRNVHDAVDSIRRGVPLGKKVLPETGRGGLPSIRFDITPLATATKPAFQLQAICPEKTRVQF